MHPLIPFLVVLFGIPFWAAAVNNASLPPASYSTAISPDGYEYILQKRPHTSLIVKHQNGTTGQMFSRPYPAQPAAIERANSTKSVSRPVWEDTHQNEDKCGPSEFYGKTTAGSPLVADCIKIRDMFRRPGGYWKASWIPDFTLMWTGHWTVLNDLGTCAFGVKYYGTNLCGMEVGNTDIADLLDDAINRFQANGRVGVEGRMWCQAVTCEKTAQIDAAWAIFHT